MRIIAACVAVMGLFTAARTAVPVEKSGPCPPLKRHNADSRDNWNQTWEARPVPADSFPVGTIQDTLAPARSINCIETSPGLKAQLWASEEMVGNIRYLQHFAFDERGRLWAVEPKSYPNIIRPASGNASDQKFQGGLDRIVILEDTDGDKVMDNLKVFKDGLNLPQSIEVVNGGVVVTMAPYVAFFPNENDVAGAPVILFSGMGRNSARWDTHGGINQIMYGLDNWIYGQTGYNDSCMVNGVNCEKGRVWRFRHTALGHAKTEFQAWSTGWFNADGLGQMEDGQLFVSGATGTPHIGHAPVRGSAAMDIRTRHPTLGNAANDVDVYYPITGDRFLWEGQTGKNANGWFTSKTTAVSGTQIYTSRLFPKRYWNRYAFTCEGANKLCNQDSLEFNMKGNVIGSSWKAYRLPGPGHANLLASRDAWVAPILAKTGPDGAVWVLDWNNYLFLHNPANPMGNGSAWNNELRNKTTNRIYRILPEGAAPEKILDLSKAAEDELIAAFANPNFHWRLSAQRLLIGKGYNAALGAKLKEILKTDRTVDEVGNSPRAQHALWTLEGLGRIGADPELDAILAGLLAHPAWCVRRNALRAMPRTAAGAAAIDDACSINDDHGHVRLQALVALGETADKPAGLKPIWDAYRTVDATATSAAQKAGIASAATQPCKPVVGLGGAFRPVPGAAKHALRIRSIAGGIRLLPHGDLPSGTLTVFDTRGRRIFASHYDAAASAWSAASAEGLDPRLYGYEFRGRDGSVRRGSLAPLGAR